jgi:hypothetical protein
VQFRSGETAISSEIAKSDQPNIRLELTTQHNILCERYGRMLHQRLGPWSFLVTLLALQLKLFVMFPTTGSCWPDTLMPMPTRH